MRLALGVVILVAVGGIARAEPVAVGAYKVVLPCDAKPAIVATGVVVECDGTRFAVETGLTTGAAYVAKLFAAVPADKRTIASDTIGDLAVTSGVATVEPRAMFVLAFDRTPTRDGLAFLAMVPASADRTVAFRQLQTMAVATLKASLAPAPTPAVAGKLAFTLAWVKHEWTSPSVEYFQFTRDRFANTMLVITGGPTTSDLKHEIMYYDRDAKEHRSFGATTGLFSKATGIEFSPSVGFDAIDGDPDGNLVITLRQHHDDNVTITWPLAVYFHRKSGKIELAVSKQTVFALGDGSPYGANATYRLAPNGDLWAFVRQYTGKTRVAILHRDAESKWSMRELAIPADVAAIRPDDLGQGSVDPTGGYVFFRGGALVRIAPTGAVVKLAPITLPPKTTVTRVVATPDGAYWLAASMTADVTQWTTDSPNPGKVNVYTSASVGGHTRVFRVIADGKGGGTTGFIDGDDLELALHGAGAKVDPGSIMRFAHAGVDWSTGGLALYDIDHQVIASLVAK